MGLSALTGRGAEQLLPTALTLYERWNKRVPTSKLNRWVEQVRCAVLWNAAHAVPLWVVI